MIGISRLIHIRAGIASVSTLLALGCASFGTTGGSAPAWTHRLVGTWSDDSTPSTQQRSQAWQFHADGTLDWLAAQDGAGRDGSSMMRVTGHSTWWPVLDDAHPDRMRICYSERPGRFGASCVGVVMDSIKTQSGPAYRIVLNGIDWNFRKLLVRDVGDAGNDPR